MLVVLTGINSIAENEKGFRNMASPEAQAVKRRVESDQDRLVPDQVNLEQTNAQDLAQLKPRAPGEQDVQFPTAGLSAKEDRDALQALKLQSQTALGVTPFGKLVAKDEDFEWLRRKEAAYEWANFQSWFAQNFDQMSPAQKAWARKAFPRFYQERQELLKRKTDELYRLAKLKLNGIQSKDDLMLAYAAETGRLDLDDMKNILTPERQEEEKREAQFQRGLLNPRRFMFGDSGGFFQNDGSQFPSIRLRRYENASNWANPLQPEASTAWLGRGQGLGSFTQQEVPLDEKAREANMLEKVQTL